MMKIAYVAGGLWRHHPGLQSKILGAAQVWEEYGAQVSVVLYSEGRVVDSQGNTISFVPRQRARKLEAYYNTNLNKLLRFSALRHQYTYLKESLCSIDPDVAYTRYAMPYPGIQRAFGSVCPYVVEINSNDLAEYGLKSFVTGMYNRFFRKGFLCGAKGLCFVSTEMASSLSFGWYHGKTRVVANSINCAAYPFNRTTGNSEVNICFIGSPRQSWHGLDKIHTLSCRYPQWKFHIIGPNRQEYISAGIGVPDNVMFHGYLSGEEAKRLLLSMDVGISTLALHRNKMQEASPLKSRQYLAQGIPFISAYKDTDISKLDCVYQLPNIETNVADNLKEIGDFVGRVFLNMSLRESARKFAETNLDCRIVEKKRFEFIASCV